MTSTEALIVLAFRANVGPTAIAANLNVPLQVVEDTLMAHPSYRVSTENVLLFLVVK